MDRETRIELDQLRAKIEEQESEQKKNSAAIMAEVEKVDLRHENALLRQALQTWNENYNDHVKALELTLTDKLNSLQASNDLVSQSISTEVKNTQTEARNAITKLNGEIKETVDGAMAALRQSAREIHAGFVGVTRTTKEEFEGLAKRHKLLYVLVIAAAVLILFVFLYDAGIWDRVYNLFHHTKH